MLEFVSTTNWLAFAPAQMGISVRVLVDLWQGTHLSLKDLLVLTKAYRFGLEKPITEDCPLLGLNRKAKKVRIG